MREPRVRLAASFISNQACNFGSWPISSVPVVHFRVRFVGLLPRHLAATLDTRAPSPGLFRRRRKAPEIYVRRCGEIGERRPYRNRLVELLRIDFVERVVGSVVDIEIIKPVLVQRCHRHAACLQFANILAAAKRRPAINVGAKRRDDRLWLPHRWNRLILQRWVDKL